jgi:hypothetical protein
MRAQQCCPKTPRAPPDFVVRLLVLMLIWHFLSRSALSWRTRRSGASLLDGESDRRDSLHSRTGFSDPAPNQHRHTLPQGRPEFEYPSYPITADIADNRIVAWTLHQTRFRALSRIFKGSIALRSFTGADCRNRNYDRRNADYWHLHGLCSVLLDGVESRTWAWPRRVRAFQASGCPSYSSAPCSRSRL